VHASTTLQPGDEVLGGRKTVYMRGKYAENHRSIR
jgi:hypothetical protein